MAASARAGAPAARMRWRALEWPAWLRRVAAGVYLALLTAALLAPPSTFEDAGQLFTHQDKVVHLAMFLALAVLARWSLPAEGGRRPAAAAALVVYATAIEALQPALTAGQRTFEWADLACNAAGVSAGWMLFPRLTAR
ncbi:MAG TPA: VanZ family protein [bacterium]